MVINLGPQSHLAELYVYLRSDTTSTDNVYKVITMKEETYDGIRNTTVNVLSDRRIMNKNYIVNDAYTQYHC